MPLILHSHAKNPTASNHLFEFTRGRILRLHEPQKSYHQISYHLDIFLNTVKDTILKPDQKGKEKKCRRRYPETTKFQVDSRVRVAPNASAKAVKKAMEEAITHCLELLDLKVFDSFAGLMVDRVEAIIKADRCLNPAVDREVSTTQGANIQGSNLDHGPQYQDPGSGNPMHPSEMFFDSIKHEKRDQMAEDRCGIPQAHNTASTRV
ncbi:hypothetical protein HOY80DRAFT_1034437 [Tuber brumale]|nr:hypothetical protein HOY80DRAFT_1034437 [Tuber brumale]